MDVSYRTIAATQTHASGPPWYCRSLQHDDPALLQRVVRHDVIARDAPGERQEAGRAAADPCLRVLRQQWTPDAFFNLGLGGGCFDMLPCNADS